MVLGSIGDGEEGIFIEVNMKNYPKSYLAYVDSGAMRSIIPQSFLTPDQEVKKETITLRNVQGGTIEVIGNTDITVIFGERSYRHNFIVVDELPGLDLILGLDFLKKHQITINFSDSSMFVKGEPVKVTKTQGEGIKMITVDPIERVKRTTEARIMESTEVPPWSYGSLTLVSTTGGENPFLFEPEPTVKEASIFWEACVFPKPVENTPYFRFQVPYLNLTPDTIEIDESKNLGKVIRLQEELVDDKRAQDSVVATILQGEAREERVIQEIGKKFNKGSVEYEALLQLHRRYPKVISLPEDPPTVSNQFLVEIPSEGPPTFRKPYPTPVKYREEIQRQIDVMRKEGIISPSYSPYNAPVVPVLKKDGSLRLCLDFRALNTTIPPDRFPLPNIELLLAQLGKSRFFTTLDLRQGYHQIKLSEESKEKTAFSTEGGHWQYNVLPFGLSIAPAIFQRIVNMVLGTMVGKGAMVYIDDILVIAPDWTSHLRNLERVFHKLSDAELRIKLSKCHFFKSQINFLGHVINMEGISPQPEKVEAIRHYPVPQTLKELQSFLGLANFYRKYIYQYSLIARPITRLTGGPRDEKKPNKKIEWDEEALNAFNKLKQSISTDVVLAYPDFKKQFFLHTDASAEAIGAVLSQEDEEGHLRPLSFFSRVLSPPQRNYSTVEREALAVVEALKAHRPLILGHPVVVATDHRPLTWLLNHKSPSGRVARWQIAVAEYQIDVTYLPGKSNLVADALSRIRAAGNDIVGCLRENNEEHEVNDRDIIDVRENTQEHEPNDRNIMSVRENSQDEQEEDINILSWNLAKIRQLQRQDPVFKHAIEVLVGSNEVPKSTRTPVPLHQLELLEDGLLYRKVKSKYGIPRYQLVIPPQYQERALKLAHALPIAGHTGQKLTIERLNRFAYFPGMEKKAKDYVMKCEKCILSKPCRRSPAPIKRYPDVYLPWMRIHVDLIGPLNVTENHNKYILTVIDALSRYVLTEALPNKEAETVVSALVKLFSKFGIPSQIISDQGREFINRVLVELCEVFKISRNLVTPYHPSANGLIERANGRLISILRPMALENPIIWDEMLPMATFAYNTAYHRSIQDSPYFLLFHTDPRVPFQNIFRAVPPFYNLDDYKAKMHALANKVFHRVQENLQAMSQEIENQQKRKTVLDVKEGDRIYIKKPPIPGLAHKLQPKYEGPYRLVKRVSEVNYRIKNLVSNKETTVHTNRMKVVPESCLKPSDNANVRQPYPVHTKMIEGEENRTRETDDSDSNNEDEEDSENEPSESEVEEVSESLVPVHELSEEPRERSIGRSPYPLRSRKVTVPNYDNVTAQTLEYQTRRMNRWNE